MALSRGFWSKFFLLFLFSGFTAALCQAQSAAAQKQPAPRITQAIDDTRLVTLRGGVHPLATAAADVYKRQDGGRDCFRAAATARSL